MPEARPRLRVCIVAKATPFIWVHHYVKAFRRACDVVTVGAAITPDDLTAYERAHLAHLVVPNDIDRNVHSIDELVEALPADWRPDLIVTIQSGVPPIDGVDRVTCPTAYISVDTWHDFAEMVYARPYAFVFAAQREFAAHFADAGCADSHWLPLACDPDVHRPIECRKDYDVSFVGSTDRRVHAQRVDRLERLAAKHSVLVDTALDAESMSRAVCRGRLAFNSSVAQDVNMRVFEAMAMGVPLLTNRDADANGLLDLFREGEHLIAYDDSDLETRAQYNLAHAEWRQRIGDAGRREVLERHTYAHRVDLLLDIISAKVDWDAVRTRPLVRGRGTLADYLPVIGGKTAEFGSFDEADTGNCDTIVALSAPGRALLPGSLIECRDRLRPGGTLVAGLSRTDLEKLAASGTPEDAWHAIEAIGFVVLRMELVTSTGDDGVFAFIVARRCERRLKEIAQEVYSRNPIPGLPLADLLNSVP